MNRNSSLLFPTPAFGASVFSSTFGIHRKFPPLSPEMFGHQIDRRSITAVESPRFGTDEDLDHVTTDATEYLVPPMEPAPLLTSSSKDESNLESKEFSMEPLSSHEGISNQADTTSSLIHNSIRERLDALHSIDKTHYLSSKSLSFHNQSQRKYAQERRYFQVLEMGNLVESAKEIVTPTLVAKSGLGLPKKRNKFDSESILSSGAVSTVAETLGDELQSNITTANEDLEDNRLLSHGEGTQNTNSTGADSNLMSELRAIRTMMSTLMRISATSHHEDNEQKITTDDSVQTTDGTANDSTMENDHEDSNQDETTASEEQLGVVMKRRPQLPPPRLLENQNFPDGYEQSDSAQKFTQEEKIATGDADITDEDKGEDLSEDLNDEKINEEEEEEQYEEEEQKNVYSKLSNEETDEDEILLPVQKKTLVTTKETKSASEGRKRKNKRCQSRSSSLHRCYSSRDDQNVFSQQRATLPLLSLNGKNFQLHPVPDFPTTPNKKRIELSKSIATRKEEKTMREASYKRHFYEQEIFRLRKEHESQKLALIEDFTELKAKKDELQQLMDAQENHLRSAHTALDKLETERRRVLAELAAIERLYRDATQQLQEAVKAKNSAEVTKEKIITEMTTMTAKLNTVSEELEETKKEVERITFENVKLEAEVKSLQVQIPDVTDSEEKQQLLDILRNHRAQYELQQKELIEIRSQLKRAKEFNNSYEEAATQLKSGAEDMKKSQLSLKAQLAAAESRETAQQQQIEARREAAIVNARERRTLTRRLGEAESSVEKLTEQLNQVKEEMDEKETHLRDKVKRLRTKVETLQESNQVLTHDLETTLSASRALHQQVTELRMSGRLLNEVEVGVLYNKEVSNARRSIENVQRIAVRGTNKKFRSEAVQAGKPVVGGLVWELPRQSLRYSNSTVGYEENGESDKDVKEEENVMPEPPVMYNSKTRRNTTCRKSKYQVDGRLTNKSVKQPPASDRLIAEEMPSCQKPTHAYKVREIESKAMIDARASSEKKKQSVRGKKYKPLNQELEKNGTELQQSKQRPSMSKPPTSPERAHTIFKLNRPRLNTKTTEKVVLHFPSPPPELPIDHAMETLKATQVLRQDFEKCKSDVSRGMDASRMSDWLPPLELSSLELKSYQPEKEIEQTDQRKHEIEGLSTTTLEYDESGKREATLSTTTPTDAPSIISSVSSLSVLDEKQPVATVMDEVSHGIPRKRTPPQLFRVTSIDGRTNHPDTPDFGSISNWTYDDSAKKNHNANSLSTPMSGNSQRTVHLDDNLFNLTDIEKSKIELEHLRRQLLGSGVLTL